MKTVETKFPYRGGMAAFPIPRNLNGSETVPDSQNLVLTQDGSALTPVPGMRRISPFQLMTDAEVNGTILTNDGTEVVKTGQLRIVRYGPQYTRMGGGQLLAIIDEITGVVVSLAFHPGGLFIDPDDPDNDRPDIGPDGNTKGAAILGRILRHASRDYPRMFHFKGKTHIVTPFDDQYVYDGARLRKAGMSAPHYAPVVALSPIIDSGGGGIANATTGGVVAEPGLSESVSTATPVIVLTGTESGWAKDASRPAGVVFDESPDPLNAFKDNNQKLTNPDFSEEATWVLNTNSAEGWFYRGDVVEHVAGTGHNVQTLEQTVTLVNATKYFVFMEVDFVSSVTDGYKLQINSEAVGDTVSTPLNNDDQGDIRLPSAPEGGHYVYSGEVTTDSSGTHVFKITPVGGSEDFGMMRIRSIKMYPAADLVKITIPNTERDAQGNLCYINVSKDLSDLEHLILRDVGIFDSRYPNTVVGDGSVGIDVILADGTALSGNTITGKIRPITSVLGVAVRNQNPTDPFGNPSAWVSQTELDLDSGINSATSSGIIANGIGLGDEYAVTFSGEGNQISDLTSSTIASIGFAISRALPDEIFKTEISGGSTEWFDASLYIGEIEAFESEQVSSTTDAETQYDTMFGISWLAPDGRESNISPYSDFIPWKMGERLFVSLSGVNKINPTQGLENLPPGSADDADRFRLYVHRRDWGADPANGFPLFRLLKEAQLPAPDASGLLQVGVFDNPGWDFVLADRSPVYDKFVPPPCRHIVSDGERLVFAGQDDYSVGRVEISDGSNVVTRLLAYTHVDSDGDTIRSYFASKEEAENSFEKQSTAITNWKFDRANTPQFGTFLENRVIRIGNNSSLWFIQKALNEQISHHFLVSDVVNTADGPQLNNILSNWNFKGDSTNADWVITGGTDDAPVSSIIEAPPSALPWVIDTGAGTATFDGARSSDITNGVILRKTVDSGIVRLFIGETPSAILEPGKLYGVHINVISIGAGHSLQIDLGDSREKPVIDTAGFHNFRIRAGRRSRISIIGHGPEGDTTVLGFVKIVTLVDGNVQVTSGDYDRLYAVKGNDRRPFDESTYNSDPTLRGSTYIVLGAQNRIWYSNVTTRGADTEGVGLANFRDLEMHGDQIVALVRQGEYLTALGKKNPVILRQLQGALDDLFQNPYPRENLLDGAPGCLAGRTAVPVSNGLSAYLTPDLSIALISSNSVQTLPMSDAVRGYLKNRLRVKQSALQHAHAIYLPEFDWYVLFFVDSGEDALWPINNDETPNERFFRLAT